MASRFFGQQLSRGRSPPSSLPCIRPCTNYHTSFVQKWWCRLCVLSIVVRSLFLCIYIDSADTELSAGCKHAWTVGWTTDVCRSHPLQHKRQHDEHDVRPQVVAAATVAAGDGRQQSTETLPRLQQTQRSVLHLPGRPWTAHEPYSVTVISDDNDNYYHSSAYT